VWSADGNYLHHLSEVGEYWTPGGRGIIPNEGWSESEINYEAHRRSCNAIVAAWRAMDRPGFMTALLSDLPMFAASA
jgi:hypothetical protein